MSFLTKIREMSDNSKKIFSLVTAVIGTLVIVSLWFSFTRDSSAEKVAQGEISKLSSLSPMQVIKDEFGKVFSNFNEQMASIKASSTPLVEDIIEDTGTSTILDSGILDDQASTTLENADDSASTSTATSASKVSTTSKELI